MTVRTASPSASRRASSRGRMCGVMMNWSAASTSSAPMPVCRVGWASRIRSQPPAVVERLRLGCAERVDPVPRLGRSDERDLVPRAQRNVDDAPGVEPSHAVVATGALYGVGGVEGRGGFVKRSGPAPVCRPRSASRSGG